MAKNSLFEKIPKNKDERPEKLQRKKQFLHKRKMSKAVDELVGNEEDTEKYSI